MDAKSRLILAVDVPDADAALALAGRVDGEVGCLKVGLELFVAEGPSLVRQLRDAGHRIFLDLKLHDIPNTVRHAASRAGDLGVDLLTIHASGGPAMVEAAVAGAKDGAEAAGVEPPTVLAVTVLTSMDDDALAAVGLAGPAEAAVTRLARMAVDHGAGGIVCSPKEAVAVRAAVGEGPRIVTPGVRPAGSEKGDQARVSTPADAITAGADMLVVGRPIRAAEDPVEAARALVAEIASVL